MPKAAIRRLRQHGVAPTLTYALGRFAQVRDLYASCAGNLQRIGAFPGLTACGTETLFPDRKPHAVAREIGRDSAAFDLALPTNLAAELAALALVSPLRDWASQSVLHPSELIDGRRQDGTPIIIADVVGTDLSPTAIRIARDPLLLDAITLYTGYRPIGVQIRMLRSFVADVAVDERRRFQTVDYHFDVHGYNFVYANFYVTDVDEHSGAHEMVLGSHRDKPIRWLFESARKTDEQIVKYYGNHRIRTIVGPAGTGFVQDSSCYHRVRAPTARERIMLHLRYY